MAQVPHGPISAVVGRGHEWCVHCCVELQDGRMCSGGEDARLILWDSKFNPVQRLEAS